MSTIDPPDPLDEEEAAQADAGAATRESDVTGGAARGEQQPDYDERQAAISESRKPAGPPIPAGDDQGGAAALDEGEDEPPTDPAD